MPPISHPPKVLVTGANGFIAAHCVSHLLANNYTVVGTVRTSSKAHFVLSSHNHHPNLSLQIVPDITAPGCINTAIKTATQSSSISPHHSATPTKISRKNSLFPLSKELSPSVQQPSKNPARTQRQESSSYKQFRQCLRCKQRPRSRQDVHRIRLVSINLRRRQKCSRNTNCVPSK